MYQKLIFRGAKFLGKEIGKEVAVVIGTTILGKIALGSDDNEAADRVFSMDEAIEMLEMDETELLPESEWTWRHEDIANLSDSEFIDGVKQSLHAEVDEEEDVRADLDPLGSKELPTDYLFNVDSPDPELQGSVYVRVVKEDENILKGRMDTLSKDVANSKDLFDIDPPLTLIYTETRVDDLTRAKTLADHGIHIVDGDDVRAIFSEYWNAAA